jgi:hypothetical protein
MQKYFLVIVIAFISSIAFAQRSIDGLIKAEKNFANTSLVVSTKEAFIKFIDTAGIVFEKGKPVNGLELYRKSDRRPGILTWEPEYAEIAATNDFGYTTGPWKFYENSPKDKPLAIGYFVTVWHLTNQGEWKFLIDLGISCASERKAKPIKKVRAGTLNLKDDNPQSLKQEEEKFIQAYTAQGADAYNSFLSSQSRINYAGFLPATNAKERKTLLDLLPKNINYTILGFGLSPQEDLGYVYGSTNIDNKQEGYLRIWRREKTEWKIAVEVLRFK